MSCRTERGDPACGGSLEGPAGRSAEPSLDLIHRSNCSNPEASSTVTAYHAPSSAY